MRVLGIDPGTATTGFGLIEGLPGSADALRLLDYGTVRTAPETPMPLRLVELHEGIAGLIRDLAPDELAVEELFFSTNVSTAISVGQARGVILLAGAQAGLPIGEHKPMQVKQALTGYGGADKRQVQDMLLRLLHLDRVPRPDDAADAIAIAICHLQTARLRGL
ncbi:MAG: crossover junction endodeoxyribonuclease RuvC [Caldilineae bacterium]|nr:crossover junction endodeoxyribonuclease RuvC [Chloroflexota bacterium]MCB9175927.1 crossover junction endodeoxyribonuclease RuvC [Caldilineae bacterium]